MTLVARLRRGAARLRADYLEGDRPQEYEASLRALVDAGYELVPLGEFQARTRDGDTARTLAALRHDVDIGDVAGNEMFLAMERSVGARSTFYFRLSTAPAHARLIGRLHDAGHEVGYHYEEGATLAKRLGLRSREQVFAHRGEIERTFIANCAQFRSAWSPALASAAAHGDWLNRRLGFTNNELIGPAALAEADLRFEAYGIEVTGQADVYLSDVADPPERWANGYAIADAVRDRRGPLYILTHERRWHTSWRAQAAADLDRMADAVRYRRSS